MSKPDQWRESEEDRAAGPNLVLLYSLIAVGFLAAVAVAAMIVFPFYSHR